MDFNKIFIPYDGRESYPSRYGGERVKSGTIIRQGGGGSVSTTNTENYGETYNRGGNSSSFFAILSKSSGNYKAIDLVDSYEDTIKVIGYKGNEGAQTWIGDLSSSAASENYGISGISESGMTVLVYDNGSMDAELHLIIDSTIDDTGTLTIPVNVNINSNSIPASQYSWWENQTKTVQVNLTYSWTVNRAASSNYSMDLSNQTAQVNCDADGNMYENSIAVLTCKATAYFNGAVASGVTYSATTGEAYAAIGYGIDGGTGVMYFNSSGNNKFYFNQNYPALPIIIDAIVDDEIIATKVMTISRNYPSSDGTPAHTRWITTDHDAVLYDPNTDAYSPDTVEGRVMLQVGDQLPVYDSATTIYQWYNGIETGKSWNTGTISASTQYERLTAITFALMNGDGEYYENEEVPVIPAGTNGTNGESGATGASGESAWYLSLSNDNASINCDASGNIYSTSVRPSCQAKLYHGTSSASDATYNVDFGGASGVTASTNNGILSLNFGSGFTFSGDVVSITVSGITDDEVRDMKVMNVSKAKDGASGQSSISYWVEPSYGEIIYDPNTSTPSPQTISAATYMQEGQGAVVPLGNDVLTYKWITKLGGEGTSNDYSGPITITAADCQANSRLRFIITVDGSVKDTEDVDILTNGVDGASGQSRTGAAVRGPYDYATHSTSTRYWFNGEVDERAGFEDCEKWIDVIVKDKVYYYCSTAYYGTLDWSTYSGNWTSGQSMDFVASNLLLAENAKINFMSNNELYLMDSAGTIYAGAAGGNGINFWAGAENPSEAEFQVNYEGEITATKGTFGCMTIGAGNNHGDRSILYSSGSSTTEGTVNSRIGATGVYLEAEGDGEEVTDPVTIALLPTNYGLGIDSESSAPVDVNIGTGSTSEKVGIRTNGEVNASDYTTTMSGLTMHTPFTALSGLKIVPVVSDTSLFSNAGTKWTFDGLEIDVLPSAYPYVGVVTSTDGYTSMDSSMLGQIVFSTGSGSGNWLWSGVASTGATKQSGTIYITI